jgi:hypothetical protein
MGRPGLAAMSSCSVPTRIRGDARLAVGHMHSDEQRPQLHAEQRDPREQGASQQLPPREDALATSARELLPSDDLRE